MQASKQWTDIAESHELERAKAIIEKAERNEENVVDSLVSHFVSQRIIFELTGEFPNFERRIKRDVDADLKVWVSNNLDKEFTVPELASSMGISNSIANKLVKNPDYFLKTRRGVYLVRDGASEREVIKKY